MKKNIISVVLLSFIVISSSDVFSFFFHKTKKVEVFEPSKVQIFKGI
jgi:hypothetical protein